MRIDPRMYTLDALERATIHKALDQYVAQKTRTRAKLKGHDDKSRRAIERVETDRARAQDLMTRFKEGSTSRPADSDVPMKTGIWADIEEASQ